MTYYGEVGYMYLADSILERGVVKKDRTGTGTISLIGESLKFDLRRGFPLLTTKKVHFKSIVAELLWFLRGDTNVEWLHEQGVTIWDEWADVNGNLGPIYGKQWREWNRDSAGGGEPIDQIRRVIEQIKADPTSRRLIVSAWNVAEINSMALPPCHLLFQFVVDPDDNALHCVLTQRSADMFLGVPFNIASYALLTHMIAQVTGLDVGTLTLNFGDVHIYSNHVEQMHTQIDRVPFDPPVLSLNPDVRDIDQFTEEDIHLSGYEYHPAISGKVAI